MSTADTPSNAVPGAASSAEQPASTDAVVGRCRAFATLAQRGQPALARLSGAERDAALRAIADQIEADADAILAANARDLEENQALDEALRDRLTLDPARVRGMAEAVRAVAAQPAVLGEIVEGRTLANGIRLEKRRVPIGVVLMIYESRPNVTSDAAALCIKSGNAVLLKGGREAKRSNAAIAGAVAAGLRRALTDRPLVADAVAFIDETDRAAVRELVRMDDIVDLVIPRGGPGLIRAVVESATVPVVKHDAGVCHVYVDEHLDDAALRRASDIVLNAKTQRPGVCNAMETLLVHERIAERFFAQMGPRLCDAGVELRADDAAIAHLPTAAPASDSDWGAEYLDLVLAVRVVDSLDEAIAHIERHGSQHTDAILTDSVAAADRFASEVTSANVMINCSTRFADGGEYGLGAEIGISTDKLHARGPMGARDLTTYKWVATGSGQIRG